MWVCINSKYILYVHTHRCVLEMCVLTNMYLCKIHIKYYVVTANFAFYSHKFTLFSISLAALLTCNYYALRE